MILFNEKSFASFGTILRLVYCVGLEVAFPKNHGTHGSVMVIFCSQSISKRRQGVAFAVTLTALKATSPKNNSEPADTWLFRRARSEKHRLKMLAQVESGSGACFVRRRLTAMVTIAGDG